MEAVQESKSKLSSRVCAFAAVEHASSLSRRSRRFRRRLVLRLLALAFLLVPSLSGLASAEVVGFAVEDLPDTGAEDLWRYTYFLEEVSLQAGQGLAVRFPTEDYGVLSGALATPGGDWDVVAIQPDPLLPDDGAYDLLAQVGSPATSGVYQIDFEWKGTGQPAAQPFVVYDAAFQPIETGDTHPVPEPGLLVSLAAGLLGLGFLRRRSFGNRRRVARLLVVSPLLALGSLSDAAAAPVVHAYQAGDYTVEYWQVSRSRVGRTVTDFAFAARISSQANAGAPRVIARASSTSTSTAIVEDVLVFGDVGAQQSVDSLDTFTLRQDRTVLFDPADVSFSVEIDSVHPCAPVSLGSVGPDVLEPVSLLGLAAADAATQLIAVGPASSVFVPIGEADDQSYFFSAPIHPDLAGEAGSYRILLETGGETCDLGSLSVPALPPASAIEADEVLALADQLAVQLLDSYAFDPLAFDPLAPDNSAVDLSLAMLHRALLYDASPTRIPTIRADVAALPEAERVLLGRIFAEAGVRDALEELLVLYGDFGLSPASAMAAVGAPAALRMPLGAASAAGPVAADAGTGACVPTSLERASILTAGELSSAMLTAQSAAASLAREATRRKVASTVLGAAGFAGPAGQAVAVAGGAILLVQESGDENSAKLLPSNISETVIEATVNPINEDYMDVPGQSRPIWRAFTTATSEGLNLSKRVLDIALKTAGALPLPAAAAAPLSVFDSASTWAFQAQPDEATCFTIPPHTWSRINVSDEQWLATPPTVTGSSIVLIDTIQMDPVDIGSTNIEVRLSPTLFPCSSCTLDDTSADIDVEVRQKNVVFSRAQFPIENASAQVVVTGAIQNSSRPDSWGFDFGSGVALLDSNAPNPSFSLTLQGAGDPDAFPVIVNVRSNSLTLPAGAPAREASTEVVLEPTIAIFQQADGCVGPDSVVTLDALVTGFVDMDVSWTQPPGATVTPVSGSQAIFSASQPGTYTVTAASVVDPSVEAAIDIVVTECEIEVFFWGKAFAETPASTDADPPCGAGSSPDGQQVEAEVGVEPLFLETGTFRNDDDWTAGGNFSFDIDLQDVVVSTFEIDQSCYASNISTLGSAVGSFSSVAGSNTVDINFDVALEGGCDQLTGDFRECESGAALVVGASTFTFEHQGEDTQSYQYTLNLDCTLVEPTVTPGVSNVQLSVAVLDEAGNYNNGDYVFQALDFPSLLALTRAAGGSCYAGQPVSIQETFNFQKIPVPGETDPLAPGQKYTAAFLVLLNAIPSVQGDPQNPPDVFSDQGSIVGTISVQPVPTP